MYSIFPEFKCFWFSSNCESSQNTLDKYIKLDFLKLSTWVCVFALYQTILFQFMNSIIFGSFVLVQYSRKLQFHTKKLQVDYSTTFWNVSCVIKLALPWIKKTSEYMRVGYLVLLMNITLGYSAVDSPNCCKVIESSIHLTIVAIHCL